MSEISDELRVFANTYYPKGHREAYDALFALADRIGNEMVEWPLGADEKPVKPGQHVYKAINGDDGEYVVHSLRCSVPGWVALIKRVGTDSSCIVRPDVLTHERPDSLERIANELEAKTSSCGHQGFVLLSRDEVAEIAARIRALAVKDDGR